MDEVVLPPERSHPRPAEFFREAFAAIEERLARAASPGIRPGLSRVARLLARLGNPERTCPVVHVVGTNGKGSTSADLDAIFRACGLRSALYTSPHLVHFGERLLVQGEILPPECWTAHEDALLVALRDDAALREAPPTLFELATALAFLVLRDLSPDVVVLEAGMGGRLDATNVATNVLLSVVTPIALDHEEYLGRGIAAIASEKLAVLRPGRRALLAQRGPVEEMFRTRCAHVGVRGEVLGAEWRVEIVETSRDGNSFFLSGPDFPRLLLRTPLLGVHQVANAALAAAGAWALRDIFPIGADAILDGLSAARWPGRCEFVRDLPPSLCGSAGLLLDGAHNPHGVEALAATLDGPLGDIHPKVLLFAAMRDKDYRSSLRLLRRSADHLVCTAIPGMERSEVPEVLVCAAREEGWSEAAAEADPRVALRVAADALRSAGLIVACGSLYLVGYLKSIFAEDRR